ncbi:MAG: hypothetical protein LUC43_09455 [Burkholderiales bacterium]|nr:hypothetical protein [Burkholderiales bacterium]
MDKEGNVGKQPLSAFLEKDKKFAELIALSVGYLAYLNGGSIDLKEAAMLMISIDVEYYLGKEKYYYQPGYWPSDSHVPLKKRIVRNVSLLGRNVPQSIEIPKFCLIDDSTLAIKDMELDFWMEKLGKGIRKNLTTIFRWDAWVQVHDRAERAGYLREATRLIPKEALEVPKLEILEGLDAERLQRLNWLNNYRMFNSGNNYEVLKRKVRFAAARFALLNGYKVDYRKAFVACVIADDTYFEKFGESLFCAGCIAPDRMFSYDAMMEAFVELVWKDFGEEEPYFAKGTNRNFELRPGTEELIGKFWGRNNEAMLDSVWSDQDRIAAEVKKRLHELRQMWASCQNSLPYRALRKKKNW